LSSLCDLQALKAVSGGMPKNAKNMKGDMNMNPRQMQQTMANMQRALPPQMLKQMGGMAGLQAMMKGMEGGGMGGLGGLGALGMGKKK
jgi:signal recognition particle subunit SRP54